MAVRGSGGRCTLVLDAGTSSARCFLFDASGCIAASASRAYDPIESGEAYTLEREWEPERLWRGMCELMGDCVAAGGVSPKEISAISVTSQRQSVVFLDEDGNALYAGPNLDLRAFFEGAEIDEAFREEVYRTTGHLPSFLFAPAKLNWFERHRPEVYGRVKWVLTLADWLVCRLTGEVVNERTLLGEAGLLDIATGSRCDALLSKLGVETEQAVIADAGCIVGSVNRRAARETGLREGSPVVVAGADTQCGLLGMGVCNAGEVGVVAGWSAPVQMITDGPLFSEDASTWAGLFPSDGRWVAESSAGDAGNAYSWLVRLLCGDSPRGFEKMDAAAGEVPVGSEGMQAILGSVRTRYNSPGMRAGGFVFPVPVTISGTGKGDFARAALESVAFSIRANLEHLESVADRRVVSVALGGGMTRTRVFGPILADVLGREVGLSPRADSSAVGAWLCAQAATGEFSSLEEGVCWAGERMGLLEPNPHRAAEYQGYYERWLDLTERLGGLEL